MPAAQDQPLVPEPVIQPQSIIVIHPGSQNLRIGRASDIAPQTLLHAVARRVLPGGRAHRDLFLPPAAPPPMPSELDEARLQVSHTLQSCLQSDGSRRYATPPQQIAPFNRRSQPEPAGVSNNDWLKNPSHVVVGDAILRLNAVEHYNIHFPMRRGDLYLHSGPGGSLTAVLANLETIWKWAIQNKLGISPFELSNYKAVLVIPDIFNRQYLKELTNLLLGNLGFGACFLVQDHVAATFGAGLGYACVVDVGDQKTSVSCVEDGMSHNSTRLRMDFGGGDVTQTFLWLLQKCAFPYRQCNVASIADAVMLQTLKESFCHVDLNICGAQEKTFVVRHPKLHPQKYTVMVGDECIIAPLSVFTPELLGVTGPKLVQGQRSYLGDPEDPHDGSYLRETSRRGAKEALEAGATGGTEAAGSQPLDPSLDEDIVVDDAGGVALSGSQPGKEQADTCFVADQVMGLDQAVLQSIERCPNDELKRKMYACILVVGGGMKFRGIGTWLQNRIALQIPYLYRGEQLDIITSPKEMDPRVTTWKGATIMAGLESANELWILPKEWHETGVKLLRERATFMW